jgi:hypothetical protein
MANVFAILLIMPAGCRNNEKPATTSDPSYNFKETLINVNKKLVRQETELIDGFITRYNWQMIRTETGLCYMIYHNGNGQLAKPGDKVVINFSVCLINGDTCYSSEKDGPKEFVIGKSLVEKGLEEGILFMHVGNKAKFILPSHLAFGLMGDGNKIPQKAILVYDVELLEIK